MIRNTEVANKYNEKNTLFHNNFNKMLMATAYRAGLNQTFIERLQRKMDQLEPNKLLELYRTVPAFTMVTEKYQGQKDGVSEDDGETQDVYEAIEAKIDEVLSEE